MPRRKTPLALVLAGAVVVQAGREGGRDACGLCIETAATAQLGFGGYGMCCQVHHVPRPERQRQLPLRNDTSVEPILFSWRGTWRRAPHAAAAALALTPRGGRERLLRAHSARGCRPTRGADGALARRAPFFFALGATGMFGNQILYIEGLFVTGAPTWRRSSSRASQSSRPFWPWRRAQVYHRWMPCTGGPR